MTLRPRPCLLALTAAPVLLLAACTAEPSPASPQEQAATVSEELGPGWDTEVVEDTRDGSFVLAAPEDAEVWRIGDTTDRIASLTADTPWSGFWIPVLEDATTDRSNVRAVVVDAASLEGEIVSWQVNVNAADPGLDLDAEELASDLRTRFEAQGLEVDAARPVTWNDDDVALVAFEVPPETFGGEARYVRQWFIRAQEPAAMWSFSCDAPAGPERTAELCRTGLDGFRIVAPPVQDRT